MQLKYSQLRDDELERAKYEAATGLAVPPLKSKAKHSLSKFATRVGMGASPARGSEQMSLRPLTVPDDDVDWQLEQPEQPEPLPEFASPAAGGTTRVLSLAVRILESLERTRRQLFMGLAGCLVVVAIALLLALLLSRAFASRDFDGSLVTQSPSDKWTGAALRMAALAEKPLVLNETCEQHCARTRREFGCLLSAAPAIGAFVTRPLDAEQSASGCRCLSVELLCDRMAHCRNASDEWPDKCAHWNASISCRSSDFTCATGLASYPQLGRRPFCISKHALCDSHFDCDDRSDELNCPPPPPSLRTRTGTVRLIRSTRY